MWAGGGWVYRTRDTKMLRCRFTSGVAPDCREGLAGALIMGEAQGGRASQTLSVQDRRLLVQ